MDLTEEAPHEPLQAVTDEENDHQMEEDDDDGDDSGSVYKTETETTESELEDDEKEKPGYLISLVITYYKANSEKNHMWIGQIHLTLLANP